MNREQTDIQSVIKNKQLFTRLDNAVVLVTGATGLIGSMMVKTFYAANEMYGLHIRPVGQIRNAVKARSVYGKLYDNLEFLASPDRECDYIVHTVSPTTSKFFIEHPVETIRSSVESTIEVLETARKYSASLIYLSSMEQYGVPCEPGQIMTEDKIGLIDHLSVRSSYSESKRLCECLCASYAHEFGIDAKIARLAQTFGAGIALSDNRMPMQFARAVTEGKDIVLHTEGRSISNFVYLTDAITGILTVLEQGIAGQAYNVCNDKESKSVYEIAQLVASEVAGGKISVQVEKKDAMGYAPDVNMYLNSGKLRGLGWTADVGMKNAYERLVEYLIEHR